MRASAVRIAELSLVSLAVPSLLHAQATTTRASVAPNGAEGSGGDSGSPVISADGSYVAFESWCSNLVAGDTNGHCDIFVRSLASGTTVRVNLDSSGAQASGADSYDPAISADGRYVVFDSGCANLVSADFNPYSDVFVRDVLTGTTTLVDVDSNGVHGAGGDSLYPSISADGRYVAFKSWCTNLVAADSNGHSDIFVHDLVTGVTTLASVDSNGVQQDGECSYLSLSGDGRFVAFASTASNLVAGDSNAVNDIFLRDLLTGTTTRESLDSAGVPGNSHSAWPSISADGRFIAFHSTATNLVSGDSNGTWDIFVRDTHLGLTTRASVDSAGAPGASASTNPSLSSDGRYVAFESWASNLVPIDTNLRADIFVRDRSSGTTERVSVTSSGAQPNEGSSEPSISTDGRFVVFASWASNLVAGDTNGYADIFVRDRLLAKTERVSLTSSGAQSHGHSFAPSISADGRFVVFASVAPHLVVGDTNNTVDVFLRDRQNGTTERVSLATGGAQGNDVSSYPYLSADGRFVVFHSLATNFVAGDANGDYDVFVRDRQNGTTECVSLDVNGAPGDFYSEFPSISADGRFVGFFSLATKLVQGDTNGFPDVFLHDRQNGTTERVSVATGGTEADSWSEWQSISADGRCVVFQSYASNLVAGDTNGVSDYFVRDLTGQGVGYCTAGTSLNGCSATISSSANPSVSLAYACNIAVIDVDGQRSGILFYGIDNSGFTPGPWGAGSTSWLCVKTPTQRTPIRNSGGTIGSCDGSFLLDWNAYQSSHALALGNPWNAGDKVFVQAWFRDPLAVKSTNLSNAIEMTYVP